jgi:hypothetical protein
MENCPSAVGRTVHCNNAAVYFPGSVATGRASLAREKYAEVGLKVHQLLRLYVPTYPLDHTQMVKFYLTSF